MNYAIDIIRIIEAETIFEGLSLTYTGEILSILNRELKRLYFILTED